MSLQTETIEITGLSSEVLKGLDERAHLTGKSRAEYVLNVLEREVKKPLSLRELYAPVREQITASGMTDEELEVLLEEVREEI